MLSGAADMVRKANGVEERKVVVVAAQPGQMNKPLSPKSALCDKFVPKHLNAINLAPVHERWILHDNEGASNGIGSPGFTMESAIASIAHNFIPAVPFDLPTYDPRYYLPAPHHILPPQLKFGVRETTSASPTNRWRPYMADLDETSSIKEYAATFRSALRLEHEELMRMYEKYSLFQWPLRRHVDDEKKAVIHVAGAADARPSLQVSDVVLLRPVQPLTKMARFGAIQHTIEIESRILSLVRGKSNLPDQVIISWDLNPQQVHALNDRGFRRTYAIRFIPSSMFIESSLTALNWIEYLPKVQQEELETFLFPVAAPIVKPLSPEQMKLPAEGTDSSLHPERPLNELQSSFVRMVRARSLDPSFETTRPPMILTGPAGTGKTKTLIYAVADVLGLLQHGQQYQKNTNRVLVCCPSHAACDVLTRRLSGLLKRSEIFRLYHSSRPASTVPAYMLPFTRQFPDTDVFTLPQPPDWTGFRAVICTCMDAHILFRAQISNHAIRAKQLCFQTFILSALSGGHPLGLTFGQKVTVDDDPFFTHLFIDEAAQATEPEILCPVSCVFDPHHGNRKAEILLFGDPRQLSPRVYASNVADSLGRSFMERILRRPVTCMGGGEESLLGAVRRNSHASSLTDLIKYYASVDGQEQLTIFLTENYRGHPSFLMMPSSLFYFDRLSSAEAQDPDTLAFWCDKLRKVEDLSAPTCDVFDLPTASMSEKFSQIHRQTTWPIHFRGVMGVDTVVGADSLTNFSGTDSWQNVAETEVVVDIISTLINAGVSQGQIGAMTPFRGQGEFSVRASRFELLVLLPPLIFVRAFPS